MVFHKGYQADHAAERFLPDGGVELVIDLTEVPKHIHDPDSLAVLETYRGAWVSGMRTRPITITADRDSEMLIVSFQPFGALPVWGVPLHALKDAVLDAESVLGQQIRALRARLKERADPVERFALVEYWLREALRGAKVHEGRWGLARFAVDWIRRAPTMATVDAVAAESGASHRHLIRVFREFVGLTPKQYQRIQRFQRVVQTVDGQGSVDWAGVAVDCGFYDQAHLIRDFRAFSGMTPGQYMAARGDALNYLPVG
ncbi:MAG: helix-turn-helix transcriptional regulator [Rhodothermales bacterium]|nr:helix-turn-helix transcriptional regulator [Rhodothermales bacterium]MBO6781099.1 helix-turn-helix transcriptional regulator [Rhodothermales bacterium]